MGPNNGGGGNEPPALFTAPAHWARTARITASEPAVCVLFDGHCVYLCLDLGARIYGLLCKKKKSPQECQVRTYRDEFQTWTSGRGGATKSCDVTWRRRSTFTLWAPCIWLMLFTWSLRCDTNFWGEKPDLIRNNIRVVHVSLPNTSPLFPRRGGGREKPSEVAAWLVQTHINQSKWHYVNRSALDSTYLLRNSTETRFSCAHGAVELPRFRLRSVLWAFIDSDYCFRGERDGCSDRIGGGVAFGLRNPIHCYSTR